MDELDNLDWYFGILTKKINKNARLNTFQTSGRVFYQHFYFKSFDYFFKAYDNQTGLMSLYITLKEFQ